MGRDAVRAAVDAALAGVDVPPLPPAASVASDAAILTAADRAALAARFGAEARAGGAIVPLVSTGAGGLPPAVHSAAGGPFAPIGGTPALLKSWTGPIASSPVTLEFKQPVAVTDSLAAGRYSKRITFTVSATTP